MTTKATKKRYVYQSIREGDKVKRKYIGTVNSPSANELVREMEAKQKVREDRDKLDKLSSLVNTVSGSIETIMAAQMLKNGYFYRRSEWRKRS